MRMLPVLVLLLWTVVGLGAVDLTMDMTMAIRATARPWSGASAAAQAWERHLLAGWQAAGPRDPRWDQDMPGILAAAAERAVWPSHLPPPRQTDALRRLLRHLKDQRLGADPTARFAAMILEPEERKQYPHVDVLVRTRSASMAALPAGCMMGAMAHAICYGSWNGSPKAATTQPPLAADLAWYLSESLVRGEFDAAPHVYLTHLDYLGMSTPRDLTVLESTLLSRSLNAWAMTDPWCRAMIEGHLASLQAWAARGHGFSDTVTQEGWDRFAHHQQRAAQWFRIAWAARKDDPAPAIELMELARSRDAGGPPDTWLALALDAGFDHPGIHASLRTYTAPRWGGSFAAQAGMARSYVETGRFDTLIPWQFVRMVLQIDGDRHPPGRDSEALRDPAMAVALHACIDGYLALVPGTDTALRGYYESHRIGALVRLGRRDEARARLQSLAKPLLRDEALAAWGVSAKELLREDAKPEPPPAAPAPDPGF